VKLTLLEHVRCPQTGAPLELLGRWPLAGAEVLSGRLRAPTGRDYPIIDGIPVLLATETFAPGQAETRESFSAKWQRAPGYREASKGFYVQWYLDRYGFRTLERLRAFLEPKRHVLDAGTGHGRDAELYATNSTATVFGIDISDGIELAYRDLADLPNLHLVKADLTRLPFPEAFFDFIACDQVIHHTPDTHRSLVALLRHLVPGGHIAFYVYKRKGPIREFCDDYIRRFTVAMSPDECLRFSEAVTRFGQALSRLKIQVEVPEDLPILDIKAGKHDLQRFIYWNVFKCFWNDAFDWETNVIVNFDWYNPLHAHRHTPEEVRAWCAEAALEILHFDVIESGISVLARKPA
jgi:SAM-dependent methyltransferase